MSSQTNPGAHVQLRNIHAERTQQPPEKTGCSIVCSFRRIQRGGLIKGQDFKLSSDRCVINETLHRYIIMTWMAHYTVITLTIDRRVRRPPTCCWLPITFLGYRRRTRKSFLSLYSQIIHYFCVQPHATPSSRLQFFIQGSSGVFIKLINTFLSCVFRILPPFAAPIRLEHGWHANISRSCF